jgi:hypothetical protein
LESQHFEDPGFQFFGSRQVSDFYCRVRNGVVNKVGKNGADKYEIERLARVYGKLDEPWNFVAY